MIVTCLTLVEMLFLSLLFSDLPEAFDAWLDRVWPQAAQAQTSICSRTDGI